MRFRTEPLSSFDIGEGLSCAGKIPLPGLLPILRSIPLRVEYRLRINTPLPEITIRKGKKDGTVSEVTLTLSARSDPAAPPFDVHTEPDQLNLSWKKTPFSLTHFFLLHLSSPLLILSQISLSTGIDRVDLSLDELNFCLEWDERSPVWVRHMQPRTKSVTYSSVPTELCCAFCVMLNLVMPRNTIRIRRTDD